MPTRQPLTADRIVAAAAEVADRGGAASVTMRNVGKQLGVEAMSLYHHIASKEALLDLLVDWVFAQIELPEPGSPWRDAMFVRAMSARRVLSAHPWALGLIESRRAPGPALLRHHETLLACLRLDGFSVELAGHAFSAIDAYVHGFVLTEVNLPFEAGDADAFIDHVRHLIPPEEYPYMVEHMTERILGRGYAYGDEFVFGLDLVLDGLQRHRAGTIRAKVGR